MDEAQLDRLHNRFDALLSKLAEVSERIARAEAQEEAHKENLEMFWQQRWPELTKRVDRLYEKIEALEDKQAKDLQAALEKIATAQQELTTKIHETAEPESKLKKAGRGTGLVAIAGVVGAVLKAIWEAYTN